jgi:hypothetical protein
MSMVKPRLLDIIATISLPFLGLLLLGFIGRLDGTVQQVTNGGSAAGYKSLTVGVDRGRVRSYWRSGVLLAPMQPATELSFREAIRLWPPRAPELISPSGNLMRTRWQSIQPR